MSVHFDGGDIDYENRWYGATMCCLECHNIDSMRIVPAPPEVMNFLICNECGSVFGEVWI